MLSILTGMVISLNNKHSYTSYVGIIMLSTLRWMVIINLVLRLFMRIIMLSTLTIRGIVIS